MPKIPQCVVHSAIYRVSLNVCMTLLKTHKRNRRTFASDVVPPELVADSRAFADEPMRRTPGLLSISVFRKGDEMVAEMEELRD